MKKVVFLITFLLCGVFAYAQTSTENIGGLLYSIDTEAKTATLIANEDDEYKGDIFIPEKVKAKNGATYTVVALGEKCFENCGIKSVIIPSTVKSIGDECFKSCYNLKEIAIPSSVAKLGKDSFSWCDNLEKVSLPQSVTYLSDGCFQFCRKLNDITIPGSVTSLGTDCFEGCEGLTEVEIPNSVTSLPEHCFCGCRNLRKIVFPSTLTTFDEYSLYQCESLESLFFKGKVPEGLKEIQVPRTCWLYVSQEYYSEFQNTLKSIFPYIFTWNPNGQTQDVSVWSENIDGVRFLVDSQNGEARVVENKRYSYKGSLVIPEKIIARDGKNYSVVALDDNSFFGSSSLLSVKIPTSVTRLGNSCFENSYDLQKVEIPSTVVSLGERCFYDCTNLTSIEIPSSVTSLGEGCFYLTGLKSVKIPSSITSLSTDCFQFCSSLESVEIPSSVTSFGEYCFYGCSKLESIDIPSSVTSLGIGCFMQCSYLEKVVIPSSITSLSTNCFWGCSGLKNIEIPSSVTLLAGGCFLGCSSLESIIIPSSVEEMGGLIFWQCNLLKSVYFKGKLPKYLTTYCNAPTDCSFYVPRPYLQEYIDAIGSKYSSIYPWDGGVVIVRAKSYSRVYGDENPVFELDLGGSSLEGVPELLCTVNATSQVGTYTIEVRKGTIKNEDVLFESGSLTITKAPLTISVGNYTKKQGDAMPTFKASYTGFKNGEDESVLIKQPVFETTATAESAPGEYPITVYGVEADNYEVKSYIAGTLTVEEGVTDISHIEQLCDKAAWYTLQGVKLSDKPSMPGVYIHQGRKVIVR
ncbi:leucine-rich repeat protein [Segatella hominis]|uniref:leucine-rich repeat protein n=1 Tax=Segatella hominis TaxID=2518605 RepID=UPI001C47F383|nr:leucine-rich repeat protein [Segatella hominis]WOZ80758.1 leucine-rich repeat protein [Segatella hominis]